MKRLVVLLGVLAAGFAGTADVFSEALDCPGLTFTTSSTTGTAGWTVQSDEVYRGTTALRSGKISDGESTWLETTVTGPGALSFYWNVDSGSFDYLEVWVDGVLKDQINETWNTWEEKQILLKGSGKHSVRWTYRKHRDSSFFADEEKDCGWLDALSWVPLVPEDIVVSFDTAGGNILSPRVFQAGNLYGDLEIPIRQGYAFLGWHEDDVLGPLVVTNRLVPLRKETVLVARWGRPVATAMHDAGLRFSTMASNGFHLVDIRTPNGGYAAGFEIDPKLEEELDDFEDDPDEDGVDVYELGQYTSCLTTTVKGPCYVSFSWMGLRNQDKRDWIERAWEEAFYQFLNDAQHGLIGGKLYVDDVKVRDYEANDGEWKTEYLYLPKGVHRLRWQVRAQTGYRTGAWSDHYHVVTEAPSFFIGDITLEPYDSQPTLGDWATKVKDYRSWVTGDAAKFEKVYAKRIAKNGADYEARVFHALALLAGLAEHAQFKGFAKQFGYSVDYLHCTFTGSPKLTAKSPAVNTMVDKALAVGVPVLKKALADLTAIPDDWTGSVKLSATTWPLDEDVYLDRADVQYARASLQATLASLYFLGGYDLTVDWTKVKGEANWRAKVPTVASIPDVDDDVAWSRIAPIYASMRNPNEEACKVDASAEVRILRAGNRLAIRMDVDDERQLRVYNPKFTISDRVENMEFDPWMGSSPADIPGFASNVLYEDVGVDVWAWKVGEKQYHDDSRWSNAYGASVKYVRLNGRHLVIFDCSRIPNFVRRPWSLESLSMRGEWRENRTYLESVYIDWENDDSQAQIQRILLEQTKFMQKVRNVARLTTAKSWTVQALDTALQADAAVLARTDDALHFIEYEPELERKLDIARTNTRRALEALSAPVTFDLPNVVTNFSPSTNVAFSLLPGGGVMDVYLGALFEGRITRALAPKTGLTATRDLVADWDLLPDPTFAGLFPQMGMDHVLNLADHYGVQAEPFAAQPFLVPGEKVVLDCPQYIGFRVKGLPKGWTWDAVQGRLTGTASAAFALTFTGGGVSKRMSFKMAAKPRLVVGLDDDSAYSPEGKPVVVVKGSGAFTANTKVKAVAAVASGYAFGGWWNEAGDLVSPHAIYTFTMPIRDVKLTARAVPLSEDFFSVQESSYRRGFFSVESGSAYTLTASGLPPGVKLIKYYDGGPYRLSGAPLKNGVYRIRIIGKNNGGFTSSCVVKLVAGGAEEQLLNQARVDFTDFGYVIDEDDEEEADDDWDDDDDWTESKERRYPFTGEAFSQTLAMETVNAFGRVKSVKVTGLPPGYTARYASGNLTISGVATVAGAYKVTVAATCTNGRVAKSQAWMTIQDAGSIYLPLALAEGSAGRGTLSGGGVKRIGSTVKLAATAKGKAKYVFGGWYEDAGCTVPATNLVASGEWRGAPLSFQLMRDFPYRGLYGRFVSAAEDAISFDQAEYELNLARTGGAMLLPVCAVSVASASLPTVTARDVPAGLKFNGRKLYATDLSKVPPGRHIVTLKAVNLSGKTATAKVYVTAPNLTDAVDAGLLSGLDTSETGYAFSTGMKTSFDLQEDLGIEVAPGWTLAVTGLPTGWTYKNGKISGVASVSGPITVTFTVKRGSTARKATATFRMAALPASLVGSYNGFLSYEWDERNDGDVLDPLNITNVTDYVGYSEDDPMPTSVPVKVSVSKDGKISARVGTLSFSATGFSSEEDGVYRVTLAKHEKITSGRNKGGSRLRNLILAIDTRLNWDERQLKGYYQVFEDIGSLLVGYSLGAVVAQRNPYGRTADGNYENAEAGEFIESFPKIVGELRVWKRSSTHYSFFCDACVPPPLGGYPTPPLKARISSTGVVTLTGKIAGKKISGTAVLEATPRWYDDEEGDWGEVEGGNARFVLKPDSKTTIYVTLHCVRGCEPQEGEAIIVK